MESKNPNKGVSYVRESLIVHFGSTKQDAARFISLIQAD